MYLFEAHLLTWRPRRRREEQRLTCTWLQKLPIIRISIPLRFAGSKTIWWRNIWGGFETSLVSIAADKTKNLKSEDEHTYHGWTQHTLKLNKEKLKTYLFSFWGEQLNFEVIASLNYSFIGNLRVQVFSTYNTEIMTTSNDFTMRCQTGTGRCKKVCQAFSLVHISFSKNLVYPAYAEF